VVQAVTDLAEGRIQIYTAAFAIVQSQLQAGTVKVLAMTNRTRAPSAPDIPTVTEAGFPALSFDGLVGLFGPPDTGDTARERSPPIFARSRPTRWWRRACSIPARSSIPGMRPNSPPQSRNNSPRSSPSPAVWTSSRSSEVTTSRLLPLVRACRSGRDLHSWRPGAA
jgi:Tripartite tricarboxylate transporter family receptor